MRRPLGWAAAGTAAFLLGVIVRFPASWIHSMLPRAVACRELTGTVWSGACTTLQAEGTVLGDVRWTVRPLRLLAGKLSVEVSLSRAQGAARARLEIGPSGTLTVRNLRAVLALDHDWLAALPPAARGTLEARFASLSVRRARITGLSGELDVRDLSMVPGQPLGAYRIAFPGAASGPPTGTLSDLGGPFAVAGTVQLTPGPGYVVTGLIAARSSAPPDLAAQLRYLGTPDAEGRRPFSVAGTF